MRIINDQEGFTFGKLIFDRSIIAIRENRNYLAQKLHFMNNMVKKKYC